MNIAAINKLRIALVVPPALYAFTNFTFTNAAIESTVGATLPQIQAAYTAAAWTQNTAYLNIGAFQGYQKWTVPSTGFYTIETGGAAGGGASAKSYGTAYGALILGTFYLVSGEFLEIVVGTKGGANGGAHGNENGGGGGTFVKNITNGTLLAVAGGGGGASSLNYSGSCIITPTIGMGQSGLAGGVPSACATAAGRTLNAPTNSNGGNAVGSYMGGAGGGYVSNGANGLTHCAQAFGGKGYTNGLVGGTGNSCYTTLNYGGFGGGGGGQLGGPGSAGGYTGGSNIGKWASYANYGGGGGSYNIGTSQTNTAGGNTGALGGAAGKGYCKITKI